MYVCALIEQCSHYRHCAALWQNPLTSRISRNWQVILAHDGLSVVLAPLEESTCAPKHVHGAMTEPAAN